MHVRAGLAKGSDLKEGAAAPFSRKRTAARQRSRVDVFKGLMGGSEAPTLGFGGEGEGDRCAPARCRGSTASVPPPQHHCWFSLCHAAQGTGCQRKATCQRGTVWHIPFPISLSAAAAGEPADTAVAS